MEIRCRFFNIRWFRLYFFNSSLFKILMSMFIIVHPEVVLVAPICAGAGNPQSKRECGNSRQGENRSMKCRDNTTERMVNPFHDLKNFLNCPCFCSALGSAFSQGRCTVLPCVPSPPRSITQHSPVTGSTGSMPGSGLPEAKSYLNGNFATT